VITLAQAKSLKYGDILYTGIILNSDGTMARYKVNGKVKLWKTRPACVKIPVKRGLWDTGYVTERELDLFYLDEPSYE
jgi:hypothetical protein